MLRQVSRARDLRGFASVMTVITRPIGTEGYQIAIALFAFVYVLWFISAQAFTPVFKFFKSVIVGLRQRLQNPVGRLVYVHELDGRLSDVIGTVVDVTREEQQLRFHILVSGQVVNIDRHCFTFIDEDGEEQK